MFVCFICEKMFAEVSDLITHLKIVHGVPNYSTYKCCQYKCYQVFSNRQSFKKHLLITHNNSCHISTSEKSNNRLGTLCLMENHI